MAQTPARRPHLARVSTVTPPGMVGTIPSVRGDDVPFGPATRPDRRRPASRLVALLKAHPLGHENYAFAQRERFIRREERLFLRLASGPHDRIVRS